MTNNDVIRSIRYILNVNDKKIQEIFALSGLKVPDQDIADMFLDEESPDYCRCDDRSMAHFLDGLIYFKRGRDESKPPMPFELPMTNNIILKKLRVAFTLKEADLHEIMDIAKYPIGRSEFSAFLRKSDHDNYRECQDQVLRYFLKGLTEFNRRKLMKGPKSGT